MVECKYLLPCGYCEKKDAPCTEVEFEKFDAQLSRVGQLFDKGFSNNICGTCIHTDGMCYTSNPPQIKCVHTNKFHFYGDECDCGRYQFMYESSNTLYKKYEMSTTTSNPPGCTLTQLNNSSEG